MRKPKRDTVLGLVFFCGLLLLLVATATLGNFSIGDRQDEVIYFPNAAGLRAGDPVLVLGTRFGQVVGIDMALRQPAHRVKVEVQLEGTVTFYRDASFRISDANMLGGKQVEIDPGQDAAAPWPAGEPKRGTTAANPFEAIGRQFDGDQLREAFSRLNTFLKTLNEEDGSIQKLLKEPDLYEKAIKFLDSLQKTADALATTEGVLGKFIHDTQMGDNVDRIIKNTDEVMAKINSGHGPFGALVHNEEMEQNLKTAVDNITQLTRDAREGKGALGMLLSDQQVRDKVKKVVDDLETITAKANDPKSGLVGALLADPELLADGRRILDDLAFLTGELRKGESALSRLITDKDLGERLERVFAQVSRAIEDAREAAPVSTFFQVFSGAF